jgi:hypothetical protein
MTKVVLLIILTPVAFILLSLALVIFLPPLTADCDRSVVTRTPSPDRLRLASVYLDVCNDGWFATAYTDSVVIERAGQPSARHLARTLGGAIDQGTVLMIAAPDHPNDGPAVLWTSSRNLKITLPTNARIGHYSNFSGDVAVELKETPGG